MMVYVQQVEEEKMRDREEYMNKKSKIQNESWQQKSGLNRPQFWKQKGMHHRLRVQLRPKREVSIMPKISRTSKVDQPSPKVVCHKEVAGLLHMVGVVETMPMSVMMAIQVALSAVKRVTSRKSVLIISRMVEIWAIEPNFHQLLH